MSGLPKLPGYNFKDPTQQRFHLCQTFGVENGYNYPKLKFSGSGGTELDSNSVGYVQRLDALHYDPSLTYGRCRSKAPPLFKPHYALYDQKCLTFRAFFKQSVFESPNEFYRVRQVNIIYFLEDDSITVIEPRTPNSGMDQGRLVRRSKIPKTVGGTFWHWKDLNVGKDICIYGIVYHTVDCDVFTREYLASQGVLVGDAEQMPPDPYTQERISQAGSHFTKSPSSDDKFRRFLEYDQKILKFNALWDDRDSEYGEIRPYEILYFLADDTVAVKEVMEDSEGRDPFPLLLRKTKLPKIWSHKMDFPSIYLELTDNEVTEYYQPRDFRVGETIFVLGRRMLLYDCDGFTRNYFRKVLNYEQAPAMDVKPKEKPVEKQRMPPHIGIGSLEDSLQSTKMMLPTPPRKDVIKQVTNANKYLRYEMRFDVVHPEDSVRRFIMKYSLGDGSCYIFEPQIQNSGIIGGKYLRNTMLIKPGSDPLDPEYYTPIDFYIGAVISVYEQRFVITGADLYVYRYMQQNADKFPPDVVENVRNYMFNRGLLYEDLQEQVDENAEARKKETRDAIGRDLERTTTEMERCMKAIHTGGAEAPDPNDDERKRAQLVREYEDSIRHRRDIPPHGIKSLRKDCRYPIEVGDVRPTECTDMPDASEFTPKHIDTPEEALQKHYDAILHRHKDVCAKEAVPKCVVPDPIGVEVARPMEKRTVERSALMVQPIEVPKAACRSKQVKFADGVERCQMDRSDLCGFRTDTIPCECTNYYQKC